jgi:sugar phosphate isomerase/epimerase
MMKPIHVNIPFPLLKGHTSTLLENRLMPEIYFSSAVIDSHSKEEMVGLCRELYDAGLSISFHAPYMDLSPGSPDGRIRKVVEERLNQVLDLAEEVRPEVIVVHGGWDRWRFNGNMEMWLMNSLDLWPPILRRAGKIGTRLAMENVFDDSPDPIRRLLDAMDSPRFGHCFDIGHFRLFSRVSMEEWFEALGKRIFEVHIHDNNGGSDDHLPPGDGDIDFARFFDLLRRHSPGAIYAIEPHKEEDLRRNLEVLPRYLRE